MKPRPDLSSAEREAFVKAFERALHEIPSILNVRVGRRVVHGAAYEQSATDAEYVAMIDFDNLAGLQTYLGHPAHEELGARFGTSLSWASVADFEVGGIEALRAGRLIKAE
jgi:stress responsive alpha/beta barrel protein